MPDTDSISDIYALDESLVLRTRTVLKSLKGEERDELQARLNGYLNAAFIASGPDEERAKDWDGKARDRGVNLLRAVEVQEVRIKGRPSTC